MNGDVGLPQAEQSDNSTLVVGDQEINHLDVVRRATIECL